MSDFLIYIGMPKTGSTLLQNWFEQHPQLAYARLGIGGFANTQQLIAYATQSDQKAKYFVTSDESFSIAWVEPTTVRLEENERVVEHSKLLKDGQARVCQLLHQLYPSARVLYVTRSFPSYMLSGYSEYLKHGGTLTLDAALDAFSAERAVMDLDYVIQLYQEEFGAQNVLILPYELLRDDAPRFFGCIQEWLDLEPYEMQWERVNPSLLPEELYWYPRISNMVASLARKLPARAGKRLFQNYVTRYAEANRLRPLIRFLNQRSPHQLTREDIPSRYFCEFRDKTNALRDNPLYVPYAAEYWSD